MGIIIFCVLLLNVIGQMCGGSSNWGEIDKPHDVNALMDDASVARKIYDFAVRKKLERVKELGIDLTSVYERFIR